FIAEMVDEAVVQSPIARAGVEADIGNAQAAEHLRRDVAAPSDRLVGFSLNSIQLHRSPPCSKPKLETKSETRVGKPSQKPERATAHSTCSTPLPPTAAGPSGLWSVKSAAL